MPNTKEMELWQLVNKAFQNSIEKFGDIFAKDVTRELLANGVTVQKWIPVAEGLPKTIPCNAGTEYSEAVNVLTSGRKVLTAIWNGSEFIADAAFWDAEGEEVTHWTPVLLPLPEPPKGE